MQAENERQWKKSESGEFGSESGYFLIRSTEWKK